MQKPEMTEEWRMALHEGESSVAPFDENLILIEKQIGDRVYTALVNQDRVGPDFEWVLCTPDDDAYGRPQQNSGVKTLRRPDLEPPEPSACRLRITDVTTWEIPFADAQWIEWADDVRPSPLGTSGYPQRDENTMMDPGPLADPDAEDDPDGDDYYG